MSTHLKPITIAGLAAALVCGGLLGFLARGKPAPPVTGPARRHADTDLVKTLLVEDLSDRTFDFTTVVTACSGRKMIPLGEDPAHKMVVGAIHAALAETVGDLNRAESPVRSLRRINEASRFFEDGIMERINRMPGLQCDIPPTRDGEHQRSGYPDLRIVDKESGQVFYLDPKLVEAGSETSRVDGR